MSAQINHLVDFASLLDEPLMPATRAVLITLTDVPGTDEPMIGIFDYNMAEADHRAAADEYWAAANPEVLDTLEKSTRSITPALD